MTADAVVPSEPTGPSRRSIPVLVTIVVLGVIGFWGLWRELRLDVSVTGAGWAAVAVAVWAVFAVLLVGLILVLQRLGRRPGWTVALGLIWAFAAVEVAGRANTAVVTLATTSPDADPGWTFWLTAPLVEEPLKVLGVVLLVVVPVLGRFGPLDGLFFGAVVGAGFQVVEDLVFSLAAMSHAPNEPGKALLVVVFLRGLLGVASHVVYSGLIGASIGWVVAGGSTGRARRVLAACVVGLAVAALHGVMNWAATNDAIALYLLASVVGLAAFVIVVLRLRRAEVERLADQAVAAEGWGVLTDTDLDLVRARPREWRARRRRNQIITSVAVAERMSSG